jgi:hypothetical protein
MNYDDHTIEQLETLLEDLDYERLEQIAKLKARAKPLRAALDKKLAQAELEIHTRRLDDKRLKALRVRAGVAVAGVMAVK